MVNESENKKLIICELKKVTMRFQNSFQPLVKGVTKYSANFICVLSRHTAVQKKVANSFDVRYVLTFLGIAMDLIHFELYW